uniref:Small ribosomal subunit protein uS4c n=1 Tax=Didymoplexis pallens TaxID=2848458 RepID=A0A976UFH7_9ASPA|nr:ribosomal protein S4 [Didymoplexis pallens]UVG41001.1 ribosomal protein S4 [Didymoplexis pallens]
MSRYNGPRLKKTRRLGILPGFTNKKNKVKSNIKRKKDFKIKSTYYIRLKEKQKLRFNYILTEQQLLKYINTSLKYNRTGNKFLLKLLNTRLDSIIFCLGMASTIIAAKQLILHKHILVNGRIMNIPNYFCKSNDIITTRNKEKSKFIIQNSIFLSQQKPLAKHLKINSLHNRGLITEIKKLENIEIGFTINELLIVEYYSLKT